MSGAHDRTFTIQASEGVGSLEFFDPERDEHGGFDSFYVRVTAENLSAAIHVWDGVMSLPRYFADLAANWRGWDREKEWASLEQEFILRATNDGRGHILLFVTLRGGMFPREWTVEAVIPTEAGLLDRITSDCLSFVSLGS